LALDTLGTERDDKGNEYLRFEGLKQGVAAMSLLPALVQQSLDALPIARRMRWGNSEAQFVRPVHLAAHALWLAARARIDPRTGRWEQEFRASLHAPGPLRIASPGTYERCCNGAAKCSPA